MQVILRQSACQGNIYRNRDIERDRIVAFKSHRKSSAGIGINIAASVFNNIEKLDEFRIFGYKNRKSMLLSCAEQNLKSRPFADQINVNSIRIAIIIVKTCIIIGNNDRIFIGILFFKLDSRLNICNGNSWDINRKHICHLPFENSITYNTENINNKQCFT